MDKYVCPPLFESAHVEAVRNNGRELEPHILGKISPNWVNVFPKYWPPTPTLSRARSKGPFFQWGYLKTQKTKNGGHNGGGKKSVADFEDDVFFR